MKNLGRALRMALKYRWSLCGSFVCSIMVALFWGANLGAVYPFVEVVLNDGKTIHQWAEHRITRAETDIQVATAEVRELETQIADPDSDDKNGYRMRSNSNSLLSATKNPESQRHRAWFRISSVIAPIRRLKHSSTSSVFCYSLHFSVEFFWPETCTLSLAFPNGWFWTCKTKFSKTCWAWKPKRPVSKVRVT